MSANVTLIAALADNGVIGRAGTLPWHLPDDLKRFKSLTLGKPVLMGRRTFESIGRALPGRRNLVLSRRMPAPIPAVEFVASLDAAYGLARESPELCVIGGAELFAQALGAATRLQLTWVHGEIAGDVYFPLRDFTGWRELERSEHARDARHSYAMSFVTLERA
ncbi:MAG: dihydrofolate reductase [Steroidobacteraceae bacterium]